MVLEVLGQKQDQLQKILEDEREKRVKAAEVEQRTPVQPDQNVQPDTKIHENQKAAVAKKSNKLYPDSALFKEWGENLSEDDQREAESLFQKYGYNVFLSDQLPLDRVLPDTRDPRLIFYGYNTYHAASAQSKKTTNIIWF